MPFSIRPYRRFPVRCSVTYNAGQFHGQGTVWDLSCTGGRLSGHLPRVQGKRFRSPSLSRMSNTHHSGGNGSPVVERTGVCA